MGRKVTTLQEQIERHAIPEPNTGCWLWTGALDAGGYGKTFSNYKNMRAPRASWIVHHGPIPDGLYVCHRCDVRACVNPAHLFLGTHQDNMRDMEAKGRQARGELNGGARLTIEQVAAIREALASGVRAPELARRFGVSRDAIARISHGETWKDAGAPLTKRSKWLPESATEEIRRLVGEGIPRAAIAKQFGVTRKTVFNIGAGRTHGGECGQAGTIRS